MEKNLARSPGNALATSRRARVLMQLGRASLAAGDRQAAVAADVKGPQQQRQVAASSENDVDEQRR
jgi:hypothetical protein